MDFVFSHDNSFCGLSKLLCVVGCVVCLISWVAPPAHIPREPLCLWSWCRPQASGPVFLWGVPLKECVLNPRRKYKEAEITLSCLLVSFTAWHKFPFDLLIKDAGHRMLEKVEFWSLTLTGRWEGPRMSRAIWPQSTTGATYNPQTCFDHWTISFICWHCCVPNGAWLGPPRTSQLSHSSSLPPSLPSYHDVSPVPEH